ncbi:MAG: hypothetical protein WBW25_01905 [Halobacteriota archaeon]
MKREDEVKKMVPFFDTVRKVLVNFNGGALRHHRGTASAGIEPPLRAMPFCEVF